MICAECKNPFAPAFPRQQNCAPCAVLWRDRQARERRRYRTDHMPASMRRVILGRAK